MKIFQLKLMIDFDQRQNLEVNLTGDWEQQTFRFYGKTYVQMY